MVPFSSTSSERSTTLTACHAATCRSLPEPKTPFNMPLTAHSARIRQPKDSSIFEPRSKDLAAVTDVLRRDHKDEYASGFQPTVRVCQEHPFQAFVSTFADSPVVRWI